MPDVKPDSPPESSWRGWDVPAIDAAIAARRLKLLAAAQRGDWDAAESHEGWINRLLDGRLYATARGSS